MKMHRYYLENICTAHGLEVSDFTITPHVLIPGDFFIHCRSVPMVLLKALVNDSLIQEVSVFPVSSSKVEILVNFYK